MSIFTDFSAFLLLPLAGAGLLLAREGRWLAGSLAGVALGCFVLLLPHWPLNMAAAALISAWMSAAVLGSVQKQEEAAGPLYLFLAIVIAILALRVAFSVSAAFEALSPAMAFGGVWVIGLGFLQVSLAKDMGRAALGLLTLLQGFQVFFAVLENSLLVSALLSAVTLGLGLSGAVFSAQEAQ